MLQFRVVLFKIHILYICLNLNHYGGKPIIIIMHILIICPCVFVISINKGIPLNIKCLFNMGNLI